MMKLIRIILFCVISLLLKSTSINAQITKLPSGGFTISTVPQGATIRVEGEIIGKTPCQFPYQLNGHYTLRADKEGYERWNKVIDFSLIKDSISISLKPKTRFKAALRSFIIPGWGQLYSVRSFIGKLYLTMQITSLASLGISHLNYENRRDEYDKMRIYYNNQSKSYSNEAEARIKLINAYNKLDDAHQYRTIILYSAIGIYALNLLDSIIFFPDKGRDIDILGINIAQPQISFGQANITLYYSF